MSKTVPLSEARSRLSELVDEVEQLHEQLVITRNGQPAAVVLSAEEYDALRETLEVLENDEVLSALRESEDDVGAGRLFSLAEVKRDLGLR